MFGADVGLKERLNLLEQAISYLVKLWEGLSYVMERRINAQPDGLPFGELSSREKNKKVSRKRKTFYNFLKYKR